MRPVTLLRLAAADIFRPRVGFGDEGRLGRDGRLAREDARLPHRVERAADDVEGGRVRGDDGLALFALQTGRV